jgi:hypothetical protein
VGKTGSIVLAGTEQLRVDQDTDTRESELPPAAQISEHPPGNMSLVQFTAPLPARTSADPPCRPGQWRAWHRLPQGVCLAALLSTDQQGRTRKCEKIYFGQSVERVDEGPIAPAGDDDPHRAKKPAPLPTTPRQLSMAQDLRGRDTKVADQERHALLPRLQLRYRRDLSHRGCRRAHRDRRQLLARR